MILSDVISKKELQTELQTRFDDCMRESKEARAKGADFTATHYHGMAIACLRIAEDFGIELERGKC